MHVVFYTLTNYNKIILFTGIYTKQYLYDENIKTKNYLNVKQHLVNTIRLKQALNLIKHMQMNKTL